MLTPTVCHPSLSITGNFQTFTQVPPFASVFFLLSLSFLVFVWQLWLRTVPLKWLSVIYGTLHIDYFTFTLHYITLRCLQVPTIRSLDLCLGDDIHCTRAPAAHVVYGVLPRSSIHGLMSCTRYWYAQLGTDLTVIIYPFYPSGAKRKCGPCCRKMAGWMSVTRRYCVSTVKPILKLFWPSGTPSFHFFLTPAPIPNSRTPSAEAQSTGAVGISCNFRLNLSSASETVQDKAMVTMER